MYWKKLFSIVFAGSSYHLTFIIGVCTGLDNGLWPLPNKTLISSSRFSLDKITAHFIFLKKSL